MTPSRRRILAVGWVALSFLIAAWTVLLLLEWVYEVPAAVFFRGVGAYLRGVEDVTAFHGGFRFERPWAGLLLVAAPIAWLARTQLWRATLPRVGVSRGRDLASLRPGRRIYLADAPPALRATGLFLLGLALMGPQSVHAPDRTEIEGIDIVVTMDMSLSMQAADIRPNRFEATKQVVQDFISRRPNDRIGAVVFGRDAYTLLPLTTDKEALRTVIRELTLQLIDGRGTAIGNAVGVSLNRLRRSTAESKVIILLTDGDSNAGNVAPEQAAELAATMGVRVYTILMGQSSDAPVQRGVDIFGMPVFDRAEMRVNPELLQRIADRTGGEAFQVADRQGLERSFHTILDQLEKSAIEDAGRVYGELYPAFAWVALVLLLLEILLGTLILRRWP